MLKAESYKRGMVYSTGLNIVASGVQVLNTLIIAFFFGTSTGTDIYFFVLSIAVLITNSMINGIDTTLLIPKAMQLRQQQGEKESRSFLNFFFFVYVAIGLAIFLAIIISPVLFYNSFSKFPHEKLEQYKNLLYAGTVLISFRLINNFMAAILSSYKYFSVAIAASLVTSILSITVTIFFYDQLGITGTLAAVAVSYVINFLLLLLVMKIKLHWQYRDVAVVKDKALWTNIGLMQLNILPVWLRNYITIFLLSGLGEGILASVNLAQQASGIIDTLIIAQVLSVAGIKFNELYARMDMPALNTLFIKMADYILLILMPVVCIAFFYATEIATVIFKRGHMHAAAIDIVATCLRYLIVLAPLIFLSNICTRIFSATHTIKAGLLYSVTGHIIFLLLTLVLINWLQLKGYLYAMIAGYLVLIFLFSRIFKTKLPQVDFNKILFFGCKQLLLNVLIAWPVFLLLQKISYINDIILLCIAVAVQGIIVLAINKKRIHFAEIKNLLYSNNKKNVG
jgi:putative peptidoglycan lipid II flippase